MEKPVLHRVDEFREALEGYEISEHGRMVLDAMRVVLLRGPSGAGRNTIIDELVKTGLYEFVVSDTTRPPRTNNGVWEQNGKEYWFRSEEEILDDLRQGKFVEAEIIHEQQVSGVSIRDLEERSKRGKIGAIEAHFNGADSFARLKPDTNLIFVTPPSFDEWHKRLQLRGGMNDEELAQRFKTGLLDYQHGLSHDYFTFVINDTLDGVVEDVRRIVEKDDYTSEEHERAKTVSQEILDRINLELAA